MAFCIGISNNYDFFYTITSLSETSGMIMAILLLVGGASREIIIFRKISKSIVKTGRKFLRWQNYVPFGISWVYIYVYFILNTHVDGGYLMSANPLVIGIFMGVAAVFFISTTQLYRQMYDGLMQEFPEVFNLSDS